MKKYVLALDQGTTSSRAILFDEKRHPVAVAQKEYPQYYPRSGWVEQDPMEILASQREVLLTVIKDNQINPEDIAAIGITNQRETTIVWDKHTGIPVYNAIGWQCRRTAEIVDQLVSDGYTSLIQSATGLRPDAYFSGTKINWILANVNGAAEKAESGDLLFGTVDSWLIWNLTEEHVHVTDYTNASRTMLYNIHSLEWEPSLLKALSIPVSMLPKVVDSSGIVGYTIIDGVKIPISGIAGDQQAALFGQGCFNPGDAKTTYGTGCFTLMNTGSTPFASSNGLLTTIAYGLNGKVTYALEGSIFVGGAVVQWLRDQMDFFKDSKDIESLAELVPDTGGVYLVPAFTGLAAPYWDMYARGCIIGITRGTTKAHIARAAEESIAYQTADQLMAMEKDTGIVLQTLRVDGGAVRDQFLMQFQADMLSKTLYRPSMQETTALGAAFLAGLSVGFWKSMDELRNNQESKLFTPNMDPLKRTDYLNGWHKAVGRSLNWAD